MRLSAVARLIALGTADAAALVVLRPAPSVVGDLGAPHAWIARVGIDRAAAELAGAALWLAACWLGVGLAAAAVAAVPGAFGRTGARMAATLLPRALYRVVAGATGLGIVLTPLAASGAPPPRAPATVSPAWPTTPPPVPAPAWPTGAPSAAHPSAAPHASRPVPRAAPAGAAPAVASHVVVAPGDSLWSIAATHLRHPGPARVAASWPRWYAANRAVIGPDPDHIVAGQVLDTPPNHAAAHPEEGTS